MRASGFSRGGSVLVHFAPAPPTARHLLARWSSFGAHVALTADTVQAYVFVEGRCGTTPVYASPPRPGTRLEVAFLDDEGNASAFVPVVMPR